MKKILVGYITSGKGSGINKYIDTFIKSIQDDNVQIDFLTRDKETSIDDFATLDKSSKLFVVSRNRRPIKQLREMIKIIKEGNYDISYFNISETFDCIGIIAAKFCKVKKRIVHSHSSGEDGKNVAIVKLKVVLNKMCKIIIKSCCNVYLTCSTNAAKWLYTKGIVNNKNYTIIYNAVDDEKFKFNSYKKEEIRKKLEISTDKFVIGHVGRFCMQKNHKFILDILKDVFEKKKNAIGILIGNGEKLEEIKEYAKKLKIFDRILFLENISNIQDYMSAFDIFILPSKYEGLPIVGIEAQFSGLPCLFSNKISDEVLIGKNSKLIDISNCNLWTEEILKCSERENDLLPEAERYKFKNMKENLRTIFN